VAPVAPRLRSVRSIITARKPHAPCLRRSVLAGLVVGLVVALAGVGPAQADPSVSEIEAQIDEAWNQLEPVIEEHNATREDLAAKKKKADELAKKIQPLQLEVNLAKAKVGDVAARAYMGNNVSAFNAIVTTGKPSTLVQQLELLDQFARRQQNDVQAVVELKEKYEAEKAPLDALIAELTKTEAELEARRKQIDAEIDRLQKLRVKVYGDTIGLGSLRPVPCPTTYPGGDHGVVVNFACSQIGKPYVWGAAGPNSYDCSGLMLRAWAQVGVSLPHNAARQRAVTKQISRAELRPGDLVFYYSDLHHVGMYVGDGWVVHAPQTGDVVRMKRMDSSPIHSFGRPV
jgi:peptidoglycan DL-endopeptidase CwlO